MKNKLYLCLILLFISYHLSPTADVYALTVDFYQDCESGNNNDVLTPTIMNASSHGVDTWRVIDSNVTPMAVSTNQSTWLPGRVKVRGTTTYYTDTGTRKWRVNDKWGCNDVGCVINLRAPKITYAFALTVGPTVCVYNNYDNGGVISNEGNNYVSFQQINPDCKGPYVRIHGPLPGAAQVSKSIKVTAGKTYWINIHFDGSADQHTLKVFDPANSYYEVGMATVGTGGFATMAMQNVCVGRGCGHGDNPNDENQTYFDNLMIDYTDGVFPLLPDIDSSSPTAPGTVRDGTGASDIIYTYSTKALSANWDTASDPESGIDRYWYAIGTVQGGTTITSGWIDNGTNTTVTRTGLSLSIGSTYYFSVKAENAPGMIGTAANSNGQYVRADDTTQPGAPAGVRDGMGSDISCTRSTTQLSANWDAATDLESGIFAYYYAIGTSPGETNTVNWTDNGNNRSVTMTGLALTGATYYFSVKAENVQGLQGAAANSDGQFVKALGPNIALSKPTVVSSTESPAYVGSRAVDGNGSTGWASAWLDPQWIYVDLGQVYGLNYVILKWESAYAKLYQIQVSLDGNSWTDVYAATSENGGTDNISFSSALGRYTRMYGTQRGTSWGYHLYEFEVYGDPVVSDTTPPSTPAQVRDGTGTDINLTYSTTQLSANWNSSTDAESGIYGYKYAIGTTPGGTNISAYQPINLLFVTKTGLSLIKGTTYYFSVKALNGSGIESLTAANSNGQYVSGDTTPPNAPPAVRDGASADIDSIFSTNTLQANWDAATDAESGISNYQYAIGTTPGGTNISAYQPISLLSVTRTGLTLAIGTTYYFSVKAQNGDGLQGAAANSNGQYVVEVDTTDTTPPANIANVRDGLGADSGSTMLTSRLSANWDASTDSQSGIAKYWYAIGTAPAATNVTNGWIDSGIITNVTRTGLMLAIGTTYYFALKAENGAGLQSALTNSNGQYVASDIIIIPPPVQPSPVTKVYPNPWSLSGGQSMTFTISGYGEIGVYAINGKLVRTLSGTSTVSWDGTNEDGEKVARGIYLYYITNNGGDKVTGKLAVTK